MVAQIDKLYFQTKPFKVVQRFLSYALFEGRPITTKGRWINPLIFINFYLVKHFPELKKVHKPIFIIGTGRSGTTILGVVLSLHSDVGFLNEPKALWHSIFKHEDVIGNYSKVNAFYRLSEGHASDLVKCYARRLFGAYLTFVGANRVVDKYPELIFRIPFVKKIFPDAKFIFLCRNGWDSCRSIENWSKIKGKKHNSELHDWWGINNRKWKIMVEELIKNDDYFIGAIETIKTINSHTNMAAVEWVITMREGLRQMEKFDRDIYKLRYEDLTRNPFEEISRLLEFCELEEERKIQKYAKTVLYKRESYSKFEIHPDILPLFRQTLITFGY